MVDGMGYLLMRVGVDVDLIERRASTSGDDVVGAGSVRAHIRVIVTVQHQVDAVHLKQWQEESPPLIDGRLHHGAIREDVAVIAG